MQTETIQANKLSALMKTGAAGMSQQMDSYFGMENGEITQCCSLGAVYIGRFGLAATTEAANNVSYGSRVYDIPFMDTLQTTFPYLNSIDGAHELCRAVGDREANCFDDPKIKLGSAIIHLNDNGYSITAIANALEEIGL